MPIQFCYSFMYFLKKIMLLTITFLLFLFTFACDKRTTITKDINKITLNDSQSNAIDTLTTFNIIKKQIFNKLFDDTYKTLSVEKRVEFENYFNSIQNNEENGDHNISYFYFDVENNEPFHLYFPTAYGIIDNFSVWFIPSMLTSLWYLKIDDYLFIHSDMASIKIFKNGEMYDLDIAYNNSIITKEDVEKIFDLHTAYEEHYYSEFYNGYYLVEIEKNKVK